ncbi:uncharacterized protein [Physcomitrium patens]|uniref:WRKY domain-containing protein n=1 Tax=Physcomitrium patens TaxID=3218 RepID=A0A7I4D4D8_PHYPA|nr:uncharacterized protein LOC112278489 [Physcomitrium patens]|eukprot:XP_024367828.1 uncharacterized protein LOC112278489 [Physcomitrella patens]
MMEKSGPDEIQEVVAPSFEDNEDLAALVQQYFESIISPSGSLKTEGFPKYDSFCSSPCGQICCRRGSNGGTLTHDSSSLSPPSSCVSDPSRTTETGSLKPACFRDDECKDGMKLPHDGEGGDDAPLDDGPLIERKNFSWAKKKKGLKKVTDPRHIVKRRTDLDMVEDGYKWRKYGQKTVLSSPYPRSYYKCTTAGCRVRKQVSRCVEDRGLVIASYEGEHHHPKISQQTCSSKTSHSQNTAKILLDSLNPHNNRQAKQAGYSLPNLLPINTILPYPDHFGYLMQRRWPIFDPHQLQPPSVLDSMNMMMVYQVMKLKQELQARTQEFMNFATQGSGISDLLAMNLLNVHPEVYPQARAEPGLSLVDLMRLASRTHWDQSGQKSSQPEPSSNPRCRRSNTIRTTAPIPGLSTVVSRRQSGGSSNDSDA